MIPFRIRNSIFSKIKTKKVSLSFYSFTEKVVVKCFHFMCPLRDIYCKQTNNHAIVIGPCCIIALDIPMH